MKREHTRAIHLTREENRKLEWIAARRGLTAHAYVVALIRRDLGRRPNPPYDGPKFDLGPDVNAE